MKDGATAARKVMYFAAHPDGFIENLGEKVQALRCGGAYTSVESGVAH